MLVKKEKDTIYLFCDPNKKIKSVGTVKVSEHWFCKVARQISVRTIRT